MDAEVRLRTRESVGYDGEPSFDCELDYYLVYAEPDDVWRGVAPCGIAVEEFVLHEDFAAAGVDSAVWSAGEGWWSSAGFSRSLRADARVRTVVRPTGRSAAEEAYRRLTDTDLPHAGELRRQFADRDLRPASAPLRLGPAQVPAGFFDRRVYRILFAGDLGEHGMADLWCREWLQPVDDPAEPRVLGRGALAAQAHEFSWELRRIGFGVAWSIDLTALLGPDSEPEPATLGALLHRLRSLLRDRGLIPVTVERFA
ncbi:hypothetical protein Cs7R123_51370 [Catellatospora sp. TT07R-123]|uniref:hypothetical protein n=1 Tax=Catellatospora sp. TT07R-123 TaxID=2733863 RepID=UPI001B06FCB3|nr:hypothetical protein [Catellatospora sp. TT07R-123]GHJ47795.1 hypothetical protein Cs7R123_51370 [Catellatospora sp. TT07R-123]